MFVSIGVQLLGLLVPFGLVQNWLDATVQPLFAPETFTRLEYSPLLRQWHFLQAENLHIFWLANQIAWTWRVGLLLGLLLLLIGLGALLLYRLLAVDKTYPRLSGQHADAGVLHRPPGTRPYVVAAALITLLLLTTLYSAAQTSPQHALAQRIAQMEQAGDAILHLRPVATQSFANHYHGRLPVYGHLDGSTLNPEQQDWMENLRTRYNRIWLVAGMDTADQSGWETGHRTQDFLLYDYRPPGTPAHRLILYAPAPAYELQEAGLGTIFGDPGAAESVDPSTGWIRLSGYGLTPETTPGSALLLALRWESLQPVSANYHVFVHLLDERGERIAQRDGQPVQWLRPTTTWQTGDEIIDRYGLLLSRDIPPGEYTIAVGLYDPVSGQRLPVSAGPSSFAIEIGPILVRPLP